MGEHRIVYPGVAGSNPVAIAITSMVVSGKQAFDMKPLPTPPNWMHPLPSDPPDLDTAFQACVAVYSGHDVPTLLCRQCLSEDMEARVIASARIAQSGVTPPPEDFGQIYFEHPDCVGGEDTIKLFLPHGIKTMLAGCPPPGFGKFSYPEVLETMLRAGFWYWHPDVQAPVRALAARLFWDWFRDGVYDWPKIDPRPDDLLGSGDDILSLCLACLIDPADLIRVLMDLGTAQSDDALSIAGSFTPQTPFYVSFETGSDTPVYKPACDLITASLEAREAQAALQYVTRDWLQTAFWRHDGVHPDLAAYLSKYENYYDIETVDTRKHAAQDILTDWPKLPLI